MPELDDHLLELFNHTFYGYGNLSGQHWFIGMEEGGGHDSEEIRQRLDVWQRHGARETEDLRNYHQELDITDYFREQPKLQRTWSKLIRLLLALHGITPSIEAIRDYQRDKFGRSDGDSCLLELLPLPSRSTSIWSYGDWSELPYLKSRHVYYQHVAPGRVAHIRESIARNSPRTVVFYGMTYYKDWGEIAGVRFEDISIVHFGASIASNGQTVFAIAEHPARKGITNAYFQSLGEYIAGYMPK